MGGGGGVADAAVDWGCRAGADTGVGGRRDALERERKDTQTLPLQDSLWEPCGAAGNTPEWRKKELPRRFTHTQEHVHRPAQPHTAIMWRH